MFKVQTLYTENVFPGATVTLSSRALQGFKYPDWDDATFCLVMSGVQCPSRNCAKISMMM